MLSLFVTGDNHIGLKYASYEHAATLARKRVEAFEQMVQLANDEPCDLFIITGDLFENTYSITKQTVKELVALLSRFRGTVVILPGNHDYYDKDAKVWQYVKDALRTADNLLLLTDYRPYSIPVNNQEVVLYPALCTSLHSAPGQNNLGWIREQAITPDNTYRLGIAHGAVEGETIDNEGRYFLMTRNELEAIPVDAWLIGHTHVPFPRQLTAQFCEGERLFNAGTHVQTDVACNTAGQCMILQIDEDKTVRAKAVPTGNVRFHRLTLSLSGEALEEAVNKALSAFEDDSVVDLILTGAISAEDYASRDSILTGALSRFIEGTYSDSALSREISPSLIDAEFPETSFSAGLLHALLDSPKEAQLAYELLKTLKEDA